MDIDLKIYRLLEGKVEALVKKDKKYDHVTQAGFRKIDEFLSFMYRVGIYGLIGSICFHMKGKHSIPRNL